MAIEKHPLVVVVLLGLLGLADPVGGATLTLETRDWPGVKMVGALSRWDSNGNPRRRVDPNARIDAPHVDFRAAGTGGDRWVFDNLPPGKYDLLIVTQGRVRIEGWTYPPMLEFDPFIAPEVTVDRATRQLIAEDIGKSRHYENKVVPLAMGKDKKTVRVLMMLIRDKPTSYKPGVGTIRHEIWQYSYKYGGWQKERRTRVLNRILLPVAELRKWTWLWDPRLGGVKVGHEPVNVNYRRPKSSQPPKLNGLYPY